MSSLISREMVLLLLQFLDEEKLKTTAHTLEKESGFFFNMRYFDEIVINGEWDEVENYLSRFTKVDENRYSMKIFFEIRKQKYLEALDKHDKSGAMEILLKDLKVFSTFSENLYREMAMLLTLENFREIDQLSRYKDAKAARDMLVVELRRLIEANPVLRDKLKLPPMQNARLRTLINQGLNWQHHLCNNPRPNPEMRTLFVDHICGQLNTAQPCSSTANALNGPPTRGIGGFTPIGSPTQLSILHAPSSSTTSLAELMPSSSSSPHLALPVGPLTNADSELALRRSLPSGAREEASNMKVDDSGPSNVHSSDDDLPKTVVAKLNQGSVVNSVDFHPVQQTFLVGTNTGDISVWEVGSGKRLASRNFKVRNIGACSLKLQTSLANEYNASVTCIRWSPDGTGFGVAYSKHMIQLLSYHGGDDLRNHLEIEAHIGSVNDLAFCYLDRQLSFVTCGEDKIIKVWNAATGTRQHTLEGHRSPVYSVCPHTKANIDFIFSTDVDGKIKTWLYDEEGPKVNYDAPGRSCTTMAYSTDGTRLFSCGTRRDGESHMVEWNETEGTLKRRYLGLGKNPAIGKVHFDTTKNRFLAVGDEFVIKFWDMDNINLLCAVAADGSLSALPCIRFNKAGTLLAVSTSDNGVKILANAAGIQLMRFLADLAGDSSKAPSVVSFEAFGSRPGTSTTASERKTPTIVLLDDIDVKPVIYKGIEKQKTWRLIEINERSQLCSLKLPDSLLSVRIVRLIYTHSGGSILALACNAIHKLWKWRRNERNRDGKVTTGVAPQLWLPSTGILMTNDISDTNLEQAAVQCFALSKNDSYLISSSGGKISLFNMLTFKRLSTFMTPPPSATCLAFYPPDNNVLAIGMEDSSILIYNARTDELKATLNGHHKRVTGLAFSTALDVLLSFGDDRKLCVWSISGWGKKASKLLQLTLERPPNPPTQTRLQFHRDQTHFLVFYSMQIAIYKAPKLECINQWLPQRSSPAITDATFSCNGQSIFATFYDGSVGIFTAPRVQLRCRINPTSYIGRPTPSFKVYPSVIAAHPFEPNQFAIGLTNGAVHVLEPLETEGKWGLAPPQDHSCAGPSCAL